MAFPSDLVRTKNWGTETLTDSDLEGQFDLIINWVMAALNATTGHAHTGAANNGPTISPATGLVIASQAQGDVLYASSASAWARLGQSTKGKCLTTGGAAANPSWEGMTTGGDIEYHDGTSRARLAKGTALKILRMNAGATAPEWATEYVLRSKIVAVTVTTTGSLAVTGVGFTPIAIIFTNLGTGGGASNETSGSGTCDSSLGMASSSFQRKADGATTSISSATSIKCGTGAGGFTASFEFTVTSLDADGFTISRSVGNSGSLCYALCLG
jgi:hypothetical protein